MHGIPASGSLPSWEEKMKRKIRLRLDAYEKSGYTISQGDRLKSFIKRNMGLLGSRPITFQHGDFHLGNMILTPEGELSVVDFNRWGYGDPWEEFDRLTYFSRGVSIPFSRGQIDGYFGEKKPQEFYTLLALYTAMITLFTVSWADSFGEEEVKGSLQRAEMILADYSGFSSIYPAWIDGF
jgi:aminoglycoside phosphotransferase (APT) family kinase protein